MNDNMTEFQDTLLGQNFQYEYLKLKSEETATDPPAPREVYG